MEKRGSGVPHPVHGCLSFEPWPKRYKVMCPGAYSCHQTDDKPSKKACGEHKCRREYIYWCSE
jgi:hypothetical protein